MTREVRPAAVFLRMSPQLREGLRRAADASGCSVNAFAVQVLATAVGDPSRFRVPQPAEIPLRELERDALGYPLESKANWRHATARSEFIGVMGANAQSDDWIAEVKRHDTEDPEFFVEWSERRMADEASRGRPVREDPLSQRG